MTYFYNILFLSLFTFVKSSILHDVLFNGDFEFIDLTYPFDNTTTYWPGSIHFQIIEEDDHFNKDGSWFAFNAFAAAEHGGTHLDAPFHFKFNGEHVGELQLEKLIVPVIIIDISDKVNGNPYFVLYKHHLDSKLNDNFGKPCVIIFKFGWSKFYNNKTQYMGIDKDNNINFPGLSVEVAEWITSTYKNVVGIGVDTASVDQGSSEDYPVHQILAKADLYNLENVKLDRYVPEFGCIAIMLPMKIELGSGAPLRLVVICPKEITSTSCL